MSKLLVQKDEEKQLKLIKTQLEKQTNRNDEKVGIITLPIKDANQLAQLLNRIFNSEPIVIDDYITPNEAAKIAGVSRPIITEMLEASKLQGHKVNSHWKVQKNSLLKYMSERDNVRKVMSSTDEDGFGLD
jgi:excisionase family DNA binding protein